jgi:hypothetical protein
MITFMVLAALICPQTEIINRTDKVWSKQDNQRYHFNLDRCEANFGKDAPCLTKFIKVADGDYLAICGAKVKE